MAVTSATRSVSAPPAPPRQPERNRAQEYRAEQELQQRRAQQNRPKEPVVNTQGQTTGRILNEKA
jgi:hypothetical protein